MITHFLMFCLLANGVFMGDICGFPAYTPPDKLHGGYISVLTIFLSTKLYSIEQITIDKDDSGDFKAFYEHLRKCEVAVVPKILGASKNPLNDQQCYIYFENILTMDVKTYPNILPIKFTYDRLTEALMTFEDLTFFSLSADSFRYSPLDNRFYFVDILSLVRSKKTEKPRLTDNDTKEIFFNWVKLCDIPVQSIDKLDEILNDLIRDPSRHVSYFSSFYHYDYERRYKIKLKEERLKMVYYDIFSLIKSDIHKILIDIKSQESNFELTAKLGNQKKIFNFNKDEEMFSIYVCQQKLSEEIECMILRENNAKSDFLWTFNVDPDQRLDVEVQDAVSEVGDLKMKFYKVFLIITPKSTPAIVPNNEEFLLKLTPDMKGKEFYIICETNHRDLRVASGPEEEFTFKTMKMMKSKLSNSTGKKISQVIPSLFPKASKSCLGNYKKIFIMEKDKTKTLFIKYNVQRTEVSFKYISKLPGLKQDMIYSCNNHPQYPNLFYTLNPKTPLNKADKVLTYLENMTLMIN